VQSDSISSLVAAGVTGVRGHCVYSVRCDDDDDDVNDKCDDHMVATVLYLTPESISINLQGGPRK